MRRIKDRLPEMHFYEWSVSRWLTSNTRHALDVTGMGIYRELLDQCYAGGSFPEDKEYIIGRVKCTPEQYDIYWPKIRKHFHVSKKDSTQLCNRFADIARKSYFNFRKEQKNRRKNAPRKHNELNGFDGVGSVEDMSGHDTGCNGGSTKIREEEKRRDKKIPRTPLEGAIERVSNSLHDRHPEIRRCGVAEVRKLLKAIVRKKSQAEKIPYLDHIDSQHAAMCATDDWTKENGQFSKGLANWLAPTKFRWEEAPQELLREGPMAWQIL